MPMTEKNHRKVAGVLKFVADFTLLLEEIGAIRKQNTELLAQFDETIKS